MVVSQVPHIQSETSMVMGARDRSEDPCGTEIKTVMKELPVSCPVQS